MRLRESNSLLAGLGGAALSFALSDGLPTIVKLIRNEIKFETMPKIQLLTPTIALVIGIILLGSSVYLASGRRKILKKITDHFAENPGTVEVRDGGRS